MKSIIFHLRKLVRINRQILNELNKDEASTNTIRRAFEEREKHIKEMGELIPEINKDDMSDKESAIVETLFEKFGSQAKKIQDALDHIVNSARDHLGDAIKRRKAEDGYQSLK